NNIHGSTMVYLCFDRFFFQVIRRPASSTLFPYTTLFRSVVRRDSRGVHQFGTVGEHFDAWSRLAPYDRPAGSGAEGVGMHAQHRSEEHTSELQSRENLVCRLLLEKKNKKQRRKDEDKRRN